jgi:hypothetical protein
LQLRSDTVTGSKAEFHLPLWEIESNQREESTVAG